MIHDEREHCERNGSAYVKRGCTYIVSQISTMSKTWHLLWVFWDSSYSDTYLEITVNGNSKHLEHAF